MEAEMMVKMVEEACPFASRSSMRVTRIGEDGNITMILEDDPSNMNAFGLVHAGAICGLVETAGGMAIFNYLDPMDFIVLNSVLNIRFVAMPVGELRCSARCSGDEALALLEEFRIFGKGDKAMDLKVLDAGGKMVAQAQATFRLLATPDRFKEQFAKMM
ncbi:MAG: PaaI family thioesterase [Candidatus Geothermincolia bacterium]